MIAMAGGAVAAPNDADSVRKAMRDAALHATAVARAKMPAPANPTRKTFLWPHMSPALPKAGPTTPNASIGPVMTHDRVVSSDPMSWAMSTSDTASNVMVTLTVNRPTRATISTDHGLVAGPLAPSR